VTVTYLDASVILRALLGEPDRLADWETIAHAVSSAITEIECLRTLDRALVRGLIAPDVAAGRRAVVYEILRRVEVVDLSRPVLARAGAAFPAPIGTLDALHLATALLWQERQADVELRFATHDAGLAVAARATGLRVVGA
jgi:predicted nucleic acid-binding protein